MLPLLILVCIHILKSVGAENVTVFIESVRVNHVYYFSYIYMDARVGYSDYRFVSAATFEDQFNKTGWTALQVTTSSEFPDQHQAYWAGFLETNVTYKFTEANWYNTVAGLCPVPLSGECEQLRRYLSENMDFMVEQSIKLGSTDAFWYQMNLQLWQLKGISDAYNKRFIKNSWLLNFDHLRSLKDEVLGIYLLQLIGDLPELLAALSAHGLLNRVNEFGTPMVSSPSCSALIKLIRNDIYLSHVTWSPYNMMLRVVKHYNFPWKIVGRGAKRIPGQAVTFSSYPSVISSVDDFYILSSKLVTMETTIGNSNDSLWALVRQGANRSVLEFFRVVAANRLATDGKSWVNFFKRYNSGTYNNQWMVFNGNLYDPRKCLPTSGLLTVAEQIPGMVHSEDVTHVLTSQSYWPSYNLPYFPIIYNRNGVAELRAKYGDVFDYHKTARAKIFQRDHSKVHDLPSMHSLMRYNNFRRDPLSRCNCTPPYTAENAISCRNDLDDPNGTYPISVFKYRLHGGTDVKIVNFTMINTMNMLATGGPTWGDVPPFAWSKLPIKVPRPRLHPDRFMFKPVLTQFTDYRAGNNPNHMDRPFIQPIF